MEPNKLNEGDFVSVNFASSEEPQRSLSNYDRVSFSMSSDEKSPLLAQTAAAPFACCKSDDGRRVRSSSARVNCFEAGCARSSDFERELGATSCCCRQKKSKRRHFLFPFFALLATVGLFVWHFLPVYFLPGVDPACDELTAFAATYEFEDLQTFTLRNLIETTRRHDQFRNSFVQVLPSKDQKEDIVVDFSFKTSDLELRELLEVKRTDESLVIDLPAKKLDPQLGYGGCIETQTIIYVRSGLKLKHFEVESRILGITIPSAINMWTDDTKLACMIGRIEANQLFDSRRTIIRGGTSQVAGSFPLYDLLDIETQSGRIQVDVLPRPANDADVQPARLIAKAQTGSIHVEYEVVDEIPERDYRISANSNTGSITGWFIHGTFTKLESAMGSISATLQPYAADRYESDLTTVTGTGRQSITILPPYLDAKKPLARLEAAHRTGTGAVDVHYPNLWEGTVKAVSRTGAVTVSGPDLHIIKEGRGVTGRYVEANKGSGEGTTLCRTETGSVEFTVD